MELPDLPPILSVGTRVVTCVETGAFGGGSRIASGAVGDIVESPADPQHSYRVRLADAREAMLRRDQFHVLKRFQEPGAGESVDAFADFDLIRSEYVIYRCVVGSQAYGLAREGSDRDVRGIYLPPASVHWSLGGVPGQIDAPEGDETYFELGKFLRLALKSNPNILECLYTPVVEVATPLSRELLGMRDAFLSKLAYQTYAGYALSQFKKVEADLRTHGKIRWKHAMHLVRLLLEGITLMRDGRIDVRVSQHRDELLAIRDGSTPWEAVDARRLELQAELDEAYVTTLLPDRPDYERVNAFLVRARHSAIR
jgi:hypothetical protein